MTESQPADRAAPGSPPSGAGQGERPSWRRAFEALVAHAEDLCTIVDREARLLYVNDAASRVFGVAPEECIGRSAFDFVHADDVARTRAAFDGWVRDQAPHALRFENRLVHPDGRVCEMAWTINAYLDAEGRLLGFASTARDVTVQRRADRALRRSERVSRAVIDGMLDPVVTIDGRGTIQQVSRSVSIFGYSPDDLVGKNIRVLMPEPYRSEHDSYLAHYRRTRETNILGTTRAFQVQRRDGSLADVELSVAKVDIPGSEELRFVGSFRDVTDRNRALRAERSVLKALAALGESTAVLVHEIKNPVTSINLALRAVANELGENERRVLEDLVARLRRLELQMRQALSFARALELVPAPCSADDLFAAVVEALRPVCASSGVELSVDVDEDTPAFVADAARLEEVLTNLVMNAIEMLPGGGHVRLVARVERGWLELDVEDDGPGVAPSVADSLFSAFVTTKQEGTGLGLPICRRIVEEHGGTLELASATRLGGACFRVRLPRRGMVDTSGGTAAPADMLPAGAEMGEAPRSRRARTSDRREED